MISDDVAMADRLENEIVTAVSRGADTFSYVMSEIKPGERRLARYAFYRALNEGRILMTVERKLIVPPA